MNVTEAILSVYPNATQCVNGHAETKLSFWLEHEDDRDYIMVIGRCSRCNMATGYEDYATADNKDRYYAGSEPLPQYQCKFDWCKQPTTDTKHGYCSLHPVREIEVKNG